MGVAIAQDSLKLLGPFFLPAPVSGNEVHINGVVWKCVGVKLQHIVTPVLLPKREAGQKDSLAHVPVETMVPILPSSNQGTVALR